MKNTTQHVLIWLVFGAVIGWVASSVVGLGSNLILNILVGIVGSFIGGWLVHRNASGAIEKGDVNWQSVWVSLLGAIVLCALLKLFS